MNTPSPLVPQGATPPGGTSSLCFKVLMIVGVHVVVIGGMLLQGCKDTSTKDSANSSTPTDATTAAATTPGTLPAQADVPSTVNPYLSNSLSATPVPATAAQPLPPGNVSLTPQAPAADLVPPSAPVVEAREYVIAKGDTLGAIARKNGLSLKALMEANPGVNAKKLHIGQKVQIPAGTATVAATTAPGAAAAVADAAPADGGVYVVKSGDTLTKIARAHGTSFKKIMALNELRTTSIHAGQKLKLPAAKAVVSEPAAAPASASIAPAMPAAAPVKVSAAAPGPVAAN